eukprot:scaffold124076_cov20-Tisochrysis_lutea.AAC.1
MDSKFEPGQKHIVEEITSRFLEKERTNTSLLRFLHEQEVSVTRNAGARQAARLDAHPADPLGAIADSPFTTADPMPPTQCSFLILGLRQNSTTCSPLRPRCATVLARICCSAALDLMAPLLSGTQDDGAAAVDDPEALANASAERRMQVRAAAA